MKLRFIFTMLALIFASSFATYAAFPVENAANNNTTQQSTIVEKKTTDDLISPAAAGSGKSQIIAAVICFFIGIIGIHRFYLGYTWQGIVQLLTLGGLGLWTLIDFIRILIGDLKPKDGDYDTKF